jgi:hypothetical protein
MYVGLNDSHWPLKIMPGSEIDIGDIVIPHGRNRLGDDRGAWIGYVSEIDLGMCVEGELIVDESGDEVCKVVRWDCGSRQYDIELIVRLFAWDDRVYTPSQFEVEDFYTEIVYLDSVEKTGRCIDKSWDPPKYRIGDKVFGADGYALLVTGIALSDDDSWEYMTYWWHPQGFYDSHGQIPEMDLTAHDPGRKEIVTVDV